jgi:Zn-dependent peptidase ImmA (M78 family)
LVRQRFTIAHELGHHFLDHLPDTAHVHVDRGNVILYRSSHRVDIDPQEVAANRFAAELLMPTGLLRAEALRIRPQGLLTDSDVSALALRSQVSEQAMTIQLGRIELL